MDLPFLCGNLPCDLNCPNKHLALGNKELSLQPENFIFLFPMGLKVSESSYKNCCGFSASIKTTICNNGKEFIISSIFHAEIFVVGGNIYINFFL